MKKQSQEHRIKRFVSYSKILRSVEGKVAHYKVEKLESETAKNNGFDLSALRYNEPRKTTRWTAKSKADKTNSPDSNTEKHKEHTEFMKLEGLLV